MKVSYVMTKFLDLESRSNFLSKNIYFFMPSLIQPEFYFNSIANGCSLREKFTILLLNSNSPLHNKNSPKYSTPTLDAAILDAICS